MAKAIDINLTGITEALETAADSCTATAEDLRRNGIVRVFEGSTLATAEQLSYARDLAVRLARESSDLAIMLNSHIKSLARG